MPMDYQGRTTIELDGASSDLIPDLEILAVRRTAVPSVRDVYLEVPGRPGAWAFPEAGGDREVEVDLNIVSATTAARRAAVREVGAWLWSVDTRKLVINDEPDRYVWARIAGAPAVAELMERADLTATFRVSAWAEELTETTGQLALTGDGTPGTIPIGPDTALAPAFPVELTLTPDAATSEVAIDINGAVLTYTGNLTASDTLTVNTGTLTVLLNGQPALTSVAGRFGQLGPGAGQVALTDPTTAAWTAGYTYRRRYA